MNDVSLLLHQLEQGDPQASERLLPVVYEELRRRAAQLLADEPGDHTLQATALVHEAYLRLVGAGDEQLWNSRGHFFIAAATAMRRILIDRARARISLKRGGDFHRVALPEVAASDADDRLLALDESLSNLARSEPSIARVVELHHFAGMSHEEVALALEMSVHQVRRKWEFARAWLKAELQDF